MDKCGGTNGLPHVYTHHKGPQQDLVFCFYTQSAPTGKTRTLETRYQIRSDSDNEDTIRQTWGNNDSLQYTEFSSFPEKENLFIYSDVEGTKHPNKIHEDEVCESEHP